MKALKRIPDITLNSSSTRQSFIMDITYAPDEKQKPIIVFIHGFKGFKDWGPFPLMADYFAEKGYIFLKFNFSHNGTTPDHPHDFADLEAFGHNNFSIEMDEIGDVLDFIESNNFPIPENEKKSKILMIGHSRGGGISILKTFEDQRIKSLATLAAVNTLDAWPDETLNNWKESGVLYIYNSRTHQDMPLYYQLVEDYKTNNKRLNIQEIGPKVEKPWLIIHGDSDETIPVLQGKSLHHSNPNSKLLIVEGANHTFGGIHPNQNQQLPQDLNKALDAIHDHFKKNL